MSVAAAEAELPVRLLAGGGPSSPDPRVSLALTTPLIGQFDPDFTAIMDDVVRLARRTFVTNNQRCFAVSGLAAAGLEAALNTLVEDGDHVAVGGSPQFVESTADTAVRYGARVTALDAVDSETMLVVVPFIDPWTGRTFNFNTLPKGPKSVIDATLGLGARELRVDDWGIDVCVAGVDYAIGAPSGVALVTYSSKIEAIMGGRSSPPRTSYLDLIQLQAYWSPERLNHHTAPTSLVYGLREALRLLHEEGLANVWLRHATTGRLLREGLERLGLQVTGDSPLCIVSVPNEDEARRRLREDFGIEVTPLDDGTWRAGLLGADARPERVNQLRAALEKVLRQ